jgi:hypothetical protein
MILLALRMIASQKSLKISVLNYIYFPWWLPRSYRHILHMVHRKQLCLEIYYTYTGNSSPSRLVSWYINSDELNVGASHYDFRSKILIFLALTSDKFNPYVSRFLMHNYCVPETQILKIMVRIS